MRITAILAALVLTGCASRYTVKVPVTVPVSGASSYVDGCLVALGNASSKNATYRPKLKTKVFKPVLKPSTAGDFEQSCTDALRLIGSKNAENRRKLEELQK